MDAIEVGQLILLVFVVVGKLGNVGIFFPTFPIGQSAKLDTSDSKSQVVEYSMNMMNRFVTFHTNYTVSYMFGMGQLS